MKTATNYYVTCDMVGCDRDVTYFAGEEEKMIKQGWAFIYPDKPKDECDCKTLCPHHSRLASYFQDYEDN